MTEERKQELIRVLENGENYKDTTKEEIDEFLAMLSEDEKQTVYSLASRNIHRRNEEEEARREAKRERAQRTRIFEQDELVGWIAYEEKHTDPHTNPFFGRIKSFTSQYLIKQKPVEIKIEGFNPFYECPNCSIGLGYCQPFCDNCGIMIDWGERPMTICEEIIMEKEKASSGKA